MCFYMDFGIPPEELCANVGGALFIYIVFFLFKSYQGDLLVRGLTLVPSTDKLCSELATLLPELFI